MLRQGALLMMVREFILVTALACSVNLSRADDGIPEQFILVARKHQIDPADLHAWAIAQTGRIDLTGKMAAWPWTLYLNGNRYQFRTREELYDYLRNVPEQATIDIAFGFDAHRLNGQSLSQLWQELDEQMMLERAALKLSGKATNSDKKPFVIMPVMLPQLTDNAGGKSGRYDALIERVAQEVGIDALLLHTVIRKESAYRAKATSRAGAMGLMQLMPDTAKSLGLTPDQYYEPYANLKGGARYLKRQLQTYGSLELALAAYNAGPGNVRKYGGIPPFAETRDYVASITSRYANAKKRQSGRPALAVADIVDMPVAAQPTAAKPQGKVIYPATRAQLTTNRQQTESASNVIRPSLFRVERTVLAKVDKESLPLMVEQGGIR